MEQEEKSVTNDRAEKELKVRIGDITEMIVAGGMMAVVGLALYVGIISSALTLVDKYIVDLDPPKYERGFSSDTPPPFYLHQKRGE
ncbi:hypothetical protein J4410_06755 [Candidatus Woesearchaeota archaeon]|nr:hypothetical protein [Candidatus Woesearchaeota archaeon]